MEDDKALRPSMPPDPAGQQRYFMLKVTDAITRQSIALERNSAVLERLDARMAIQPSAPLFDPRTLVVRSILVAGVAALIGSFSALAWAAL